MAKEIVGVFTFRNEGDGCLTSKYLEHTENTTYTECAKRDANAPSLGDPFEGAYRTSWLESNNNNETADLSISRQGDIYLVEWRNLTNNPSLRYSGRAMLFEGKLVGSYWNP